MPDRIRAYNLVGLGDDVPLVQVQLGAVGGRGRLKVECPGFRVEMDRGDVPGKGWGDGGPLLKNAAPRLRPAPSRVLRPSC